ncbi:MAG: hypothetical protein IJ875_07005, partial [Solobacterium sp.]|nr:hypothetical protein [Solobacterium sp.]
PEYSYLELRLDRSEVETDLLYIERSYIREDNQGKYVMKDEDGVLKKQYIKTGRVLWGETVEILEGLTLEDSIAFPYGDGAIEGVKTIQAEEGGMFY